MPPENLEALRRVIEGSPVPIASGERVFGHFEYGRPFQHAVPDVVQPDLTHAGGFLGLKKIAAMADAHYVRWRHITLTARSARRRPSTLAPP